MNGPLVTARIIGEQLGSKDPVIVAFGLQDNQKYRPLFPHGVSWVFLGSFRLILIIFFSYKKFFFLERIQ